MVLYSSIGYLEFMKTIFCTERKFCRCITTHTHTITAIRGRSSNIYGRGGGRYIKLTKKVIFTRVGGGGGKIRSSPICWGGTCPPPPPDLPMATKLQNIYKTTNNYQPFLLPTINKILQTSMYKWSIFNTDYSSRASYSKSQGVAFYTSCCVRVDILL